MKEEEQENKYPCSGCGKPTELCPMCFGDDPYAMDGQHGGFVVCQDEKCKSYQYCCGC